MEKAGGSRLLQMQARFQQRQMQEKEHKILSLYEAQQARTLTRLSSSSITTTASVDSVTPSRRGKVRQMFEERRHKAGIDKSYPLQPLDRNPPRRPIVDAHKPVNTEKKPVKATVSHALRKLNKDTVTTGGDVNHNTQKSISMGNKNNNLHEDSSRRPREDVAAPNRVTRDDVIEGRDDVIDGGDDVTDGRDRGATSPPKQTSTQPSPTKIIQGKRSPVVSKQPARHAPINATPARTNQAAGSRTDKVSPDDRSPQQNAQSAGRAARMDGSGSSGDACCSTCGRSFAADRLAKHEDICRKTNAKKRKPYDALKHRVAGTEVEPFVKQIRKQPTRPAPAAQPTRAAKPGSSNWRKTHEEFISTIRAAKAAQAHVAAGGKLSDLPPPPPSENPDYVRCPHCERRFSRAAADRHVPQCADYRFNKPGSQPRKPALQRRR